jgi:hypothetical protein
METSVTMLELGFDIVAKDLGARDAAGVSSGLMESSKGPGGGGTRRRSIVADAQFGIGITPARTRFGLRRVPLGDERCNVVAQVRDR